MVLWNRTGDGVLHESSNGHTLDFEPQSFRCFLTASGLGNRPQIELVSRNTTLTDPVGAVRLMSKKKT
jgi:hypothetical protein